MTRKVRSCEELKIASKHKVKVLISQRRLSNCETLQVMVQNLLNSSVSTGKNLVTRNSGRELEHCRFGMGRLVEHSCFGKAFVGY